MSMVEVVDSSSSKSNVEWGAVFAGVSIATAIALILLGFGAAIGLGVSSPYEGEGLSPVAFAIAAGLYLLWVQVMAFYIGGYVTARLRGRMAGATEHEVDVRDGLHGLVMWAVGVLAAAFIAFAGIGGMGVAARAPQGQVATSIARVADQQVEQQINDSAAQEATQGGADAAAASQAQRRAEVARKLSVISAFIAAASLLIGAVAAFFGAHSGGHHRDRNEAWAFFTSYVRPRTISAKS